MRPKCSRSGKDVVLLGQEAAAGIHQVEARQPVLRRDLLRYLDRDERETQDGNCGEHQREVARGEMGFHQESIAATVSAIER